MHGMGCRPYPSHSRKSGKVGRQASDGAGGAGHLWRPAHAGDGISSELRSEKVELGAAVWLSFLSGDDGTSVPMLGTPVCDL